MPRQRNRLLRNPFHQAAIPRNDISMMINNIIAVTRIHMTLSEGKTNRIRDTLTERACGCLNARHMAIFRMTRRDSAELTEVLYLLHRHGLIAR